MYKFYHQFVNGSRNVNLYCDHIDAEFHSVYPINLAKSMILEKSDVCLVWKLYQYVLQTH